MGYKNSGRVQLHPPHVGTRHLLGVVQVGESAGAGQSRLALSRGGATPRANDFRLNVSWRKDDGGPRRVAHSSSWHSSRHLSGIEDIHSGVKERREFRHGGHGQFEEKWEGEGEKLKVTRIKAQVTSTTGSAKISNTCVYGTVKVKGAIKRNTHWMLNWRATAQSRRSFGGVERAHRAAIQQGPNLAPTCRYAGPAGVPVHAMLSS